MYGICGAQDNCQCNFQHLKTCDLAHSVREWDAKRKTRNFRNLLKTTGLFSFVSTILQQQPQRSRTQTSKRKNMIKEEKERKNTIFSEKLCRPWMMNSYNDHISRECSDMKRNIYINVSSEAAALSERNWNLNDSRIELSRASFCSRLCARTLYVCSLRVIRASTAMKHVPYDHDIYIYIYDDMGKHSIAATSIAVLRSEIIKTTTMTSITFSVLIFGLVCALNFSFSNKRNGTQFVVGITSFSFFSLPYTKRIDFLHTYIRVCT